LAESKEQSDVFIDLAVNEISRIENLFLLGIKIPKLQVSTKIQESSPSKWIKNLMTSLIDHCDCQI
ncbi:MAG: hypothetical protein ACJA1A_003947, partial [Saprospiraceae bacterium]